MSKTIITYAGRDFSEADIELIKWTRKKYSHLSITELAGTVCEFLGWTTPAGRTKDVQCINFLRKLGEENIITIPPISKMARTRSVNDILPEISKTEEIIEGSLKEYTPITLEIAPRGEKLKLWKAYINEYHMLGYKQAFGSRLYYFIKSKDKILGCLQFSASSWKLSERDN